MRVLPLILTLIATMAGAGSAQQAERMPFPFVDEASSEPDLMAVRAALVRALLDRDRRTFTSLVTHDFGGPTERARTEWIETVTSARADILVTLLQGGGAFDDSGRFCAPYWRQYRLDRVELPASIRAEINPAAVLVPGTPVFAQASEQSDELGKLNLELVRLENEDQRGSFTAIRWNGKPGWVRSSHLSNPLSTSEACFERHDGQWRLSHFEVF